MPQCRSCGQEIEWLKLKSGKSHPVNVKPVFIEGREGTPIEAYKSHFATCENADEHRSPR